jgi:Ran GTPase-activating protein (RanGAP) involved in mRNA processing and transport
MVNKTKVMKYLDLSENEFCDDEDSVEYMLDLITQLKENKTLRTLNIARCYFPREVGEALLALLTHNQTLVDIDLTDNKFPMKT